MCYIVISKMVNETETPVTVVGAPSSGSGGTATIDWATYSFPKPIDLSGMPDKFSGGLLFLVGRKR